LQDTDWCSPIYSSSELEKSRKQTASASCSSSSETLRHASAHAPAETADKNICYPPTTSEVFNSYAAGNQNGGSFNPGYSSEPVCSRSNAVADETISSDLCAPSTVTLTRDSGPRNFMSHAVTDSFNKTAEQQCFPAAGDSSQATIASSWLWSHSGRVSAGDRPSEVKDDIRSEPVRNRSSWMSPSGLLNSFARSRPARDHALNYEATAADSKRCRLQESPSITFATSSSVPDRDRMHANSHLSFTSVSNSAWCGPATPHAQMHVEHRVNTWHDDPPPASVVDSWSRRSDVVASSDFAVDPPRSSLCGHRLTDVDSRAALPAQEGSMMGDGAMDSEDSKGDDGEIGSWIAASLALQ
jgi:hypothetical protein